MTSELSDERFRGDAVGQALDVERAERLRLSRENKDLLVSRPTKSPDTSSMMTAVYFNLTVWIKKSERLRLFFCCCCLICDFWRLGWTSVRLLWKPWRSSWRRRSRKLKLLQVREELQQVWEESLLARQKAKTHWGLAAEWSNVKNEKTFRNVKTMYAEMVEETIKQQKKVYT